MKKFKKGLLILTSVFAVVISMIMPSVILNARSKAELDRSETWEVPETDLSHYFEMPIVEKLRIAGNWEHMYKLDSPDLNGIWKNVRGVLQDALSYLGIDIDNNFKIKKTTFAVAIENVKALRVVIVDMTYGDSEYWVVTLDYETGMMLRLSATQLSRYGNLQSCRIFNDDLGVVLTGYYNMFTGDEGGKFWYENEFYLGASYYSSVNGEMQYLFPYYSSEFRKIRFNYRTINKLLDENGMSDYDGYSAPTAAAF